MEQTHLLCAGVHPATAKHRLSHLIRPFLHPLAFTTWPSFLQPPGLSLPTLWPRPYAKLSFIFWPHSWKIGRTAVIVADPLSTRALQSAQPFLDLFLCSLLLSTLCQAEYTVMCAGSEELTLDLKGILFKSSILPLQGTALVVNIQPNEARVRVTAFILFDPVLYSVSCTNMPL